MTKKMLIWIIVLSFLVGGVVGYLITIQTFGRYNALNATCTTLNTAVENQMLTNEQVLELGSLTKDKLGDSQAAQYFKANKKHLENASPFSNCSQFIVGMSE